MSTELIKKAIENLSPLFQGGKVAVQDMINKRGGDIVKIETDTSGNIKYFFAKDDYFYYDSISAQTTKKDRKNLKVRFIGKGSSMSLLNGKIYEVLAIEDDSYRIIDETGEDYLYPADVFQIVSDSTEI